MYLAPSSLVLLQRKNSRCLYILCLHEPFRNPIIRHWQFIQRLGSCAWDQLQRARHVARDKSFTKWPPAIRLFHPFGDADEMALRVAEWVEEYQIEPFEITLSQWSIVPHAEAMEADWEAMQGLANDETDLKDMQEDDYLTDEERQVQALIAREEKRGREKLRERQRRGQLLSKKPRPVVEDKEVSKFRLLQKQKQMYEEFNGPAVICLEPDLDGQAKLQALREVFLECMTPEEAERFGKYSPTSPVSTNCHRLPLAVQNAEVAYRPLVPIAAFPTVSSAIEMARTLRSLWDPLTFEVTDLHLMSDGSSFSGSTSTAKAESVLGGDDSDNREYNVFHKAADEERQLTESGQYGCDALIMLAGHEMDIDQEIDEDMALALYEQGISGGELVDNNGDENYAADADELEEWLFQDDDFDEGSVVVIGRTHFFTGEMRQYVGMPAFSVMDGKDRVLGDSVSGAARRRGAVHRSSGRLSEHGNWGHIAQDYLPRTNKERARKERSRSESHTTGTLFRDEWSTTGTFSSFEVTNLSLQWKPAPSVLL